MMVKVFSPEHLGIVYDNLERKNYMEMWKKIIKEENINSIYKDDAGSLIGDTCNYM